MADDKENPLSRWSRLKRASGRAGEEPKPATPAAEGPPPELPPLDQLGSDSDFSAFMDRRVDDGLRRLALKKLFGDPRLNASDGLDVFSEDYSLLEDLPQELVAKLEHVRRTLRRPEPEQVAEKEAKQEQDIAQEDKQETEQVKVETEQVKVETERNEQDDGDKA
jgi:Protein of unknown function (DUF3306)